MAQREIVSETKGVQVTGIFRVSCGEFLKPDMQRAEPSATEHLAMSALSEDMMGVRDKEELDSKRVPLLKTTRVRVDATETDRII